MSLNYEELAESAEAQPEDTPPPESRIGPVTIMPDGSIRDATTGDVLAGAPPIPDVEGESGPGRELSFDLSLAAFALWPVAALVAVIGDALAPVTASQHFFGAAIVLVLLAERIWWELRHMARPTAPEGVIHVAHQGIDPTADPQEQ